MALYFKCLPVIFLLQSYFHFGQTVKCYFCSMVSPSPYINETKRLCSEFDYSDKYIIDCPYSTFCMKKILNVDLQAKVINSTARECAPQKNIIQDYDGTGWQKKIIIEEPYTEGCMQDNNKGQLLSTTTHCYCKGDLCNASQALHGQTTFNNILAVICSYILVSFLWSS